MTKTNYIYPESMLAALKSTWETKIYEHETVPPLPALAVMSSVLETAYHASFLTEEARRIGFRLVLCCPDDLKSHRKIVTRTPVLDPVLLTQPRPFNVGEVLRLAPATDFTRALVCVGPRTKTGKGQKELVIWGVIDAGSSWWQFMHGESSHGCPPPSFLTVSSCEPGNLTISRGGFIVMTLRNGKITRPMNAVFWRGPVADFFQSDCSAFRKAVKDKIAEHKLKIDRDTTDYAEREYMEYFDRILFHLRERAHGGTLIVVPDYITHADTRLTDRILIKYPLLYDRGWGLLLDGLVNHHRYYDLYFPLSKQKNISGKNFSALHSLDWEKDRIAEALADSVKFVASLGGVDGAIVMTTRHRVLGFGAEVIAASPSLTQVQIAHDPEGKKTTATRVDGYGTRHRSTFRFCSSFEDAVAFVVSQDGSVKAVRRNGAEVVVWNDINLGSFGI